MDDIRASRSLSALLQNRRLQIGLRLFIWTFVLACLGHTVALSASSFTIQSWQTQQGLPENQVTCLAQTPDGYLWVGTQDGLARFDGVRFVNFSLQDGLRNTFIWTLYADRQGNLWAGSLGGGLSLWQNGHFRTYDTRDGLPSSAISQITEDADGKLWLATGRGLAVMQNGRFGQPALAGLPDNLQRLGVNTLYYGRDGTLWFGIYQNGLWQLQNGKCSPVFGSNTPPELKDTCHKIWEDRTGRLWVCTGLDKLLCRDGEQWKEFKIDRTSALGILRSIAEEPDGTIWTGSIHNGLYFVEGDHLEHLTMDDGLTENAISSLLVDREGNLWVGTTGGGLDRLTRNRVSSYSRSEGLGYPKVRGVAEIAPGVFWVGTLGDGMFQWQDGHFSRPNTSPEFRSYVFVNSLLVTRDGRCWAGMGNGVFCFVNGQIETHKDWLEKLQNKSVLALCEDKDNGVWMGVDVFLYRVQNDRLELQTNCVFSSGITSIVQDHDGTLWIATRGNGICRLQNGTKKMFTRQEGLGSDQVLTLHLDSKGLLWAGTGDGGISRFQNESFVTFTTRNGLPDNTISQILEDERGDLWLGCNRGIVCISIKQFDDIISGETTSLIPRIIGVGDGMRSEECTGGYGPAGLKMKSGELCFPTLRGIVVLNPKKVIFKSMPPTVWLEEVLVDDALQHLSLTTNKQAGEPPNKLVISPGTHRLEFHYTGLNFSAPERVRFRYQLEGFDPGWVEAGRRRSAYYNNLAPGEYHFRVAACNNSGIWSSDNASLTVEIEPHLWQQTWFVPTAYLAGMVMAGFVAWRIERRRQKRKREKLEALHAIERERTRIARDIHDDLGSTLSEIRILSDFAQTPNNSAERIQSDMRQIATKALDSSQKLDEIVWAVDPQSDTVENFINYACNFASEHLTLAGVHFRFELPETVPARNLHAETRHNLFLAFKEVITNIVKHAAATMVHIKMSLSGNVFSIIVSDDGRGFAIQEAQTAPSPGGIRGGHGLGNIQTRLSAVGGQINIQSAVGKGTTVHFQIKC